MDNLYRAADLATPMAIRVAATLRLADHIAGGATSDAALAELAHVDRAALRQLMAHLVKAEVFDEPTPGQYALADIGRELLGELRDWLDIEGGVGRGDLAFFGLLGAVRRGVPAYPAVYGKDFWDDLDSDKALAASFDDLMQREPKLPDLLAGYDWSSVQKVVDLGGGSGTLLSGLLTANSHLNGILVELPGPAAMARATFAEAGISDRCAAVTASFFDPLPAGADVYVLCRTIENWSRDEAIALLTRCREAAGAAGQVLLVEEGKLDEESRDTEMGLRMLVFVGGDFYSLTDLEKMASAAGLAIAATFNGEHNCLVTLRSV